MRRVEVSALLHLVRRGATVTLIAKPGEHVHVVLAGICHGAYISRVADDAVTVVLAAASDDHHHEHEPQIVVDIRASQEMKEERTWHWSQLPCP